MKTLYLCYFGVREPLVQTQVIPYLRALNRAGVETHLLTFEGSGARACHRAEDRRETRARLAAEGITWYGLRYHRRPTLPATLYDIAVGTVWAAWLVRRHGIDVLHARSHVPATMALALKHLLGRKFLFDLRGMMADEFAEAGHWPHGGLRFRLTKRMERRLVSEADAIVTLTARIQEHLGIGYWALGVGADGVRRHPTPNAQYPIPNTRRPAAVIPCCVDLARFDGAREQRSRIREELGLGPGPVIAYLGALGGMYLTAEVAAFTAAAVAATPEARLLAMTQSDPEPLRRELSRRGVPETAYRIRFVPPEQVPAHLGAADMALSLIRPGFSKMACSPTKIAEYLAAGLPVISNAGIGDIDRVLCSGQAGIVLEELTQAAYQEAFLAICSSLETDGGLAERCMKTAREWFDLATVGGPAYVRLYQELKRE